MNVTPSGIFRWLKSALPDGESILIAAICLSGLSILLDLVGVDIVAFLAAMTTSERFLSVVGFAVCSKVAETVRERTDDSWRL